MKLRSINQRFLNNLRNKYPRTYFTTKEAEQVYYWNHWLSCNDRYEYLGNSNIPPDHFCQPIEVPGRDTDPCTLHWRKRTNEEIREFHHKQGAEIDNWGRMSARNTLTAAVQHGQLRRVRKGVYTFIGVKQS